MQHLRNGVVDGSDELSDRAAEISDAGEKFRWDRVGKSGAGLALYPRFASLSSGGGELAADGARNQAAVSFDEPTTSGTAPPVSSATPPVQRVLSLRAGE